MPGLCLHLGLRQEAVEDAIDIGADLGEVTITPQSQHVTMCPLHMPSNYIAGASRKLLLSNHELIPAVIEC